MNNQNNMNNLFSNGLFNSTPQKDYSTSYTGMGTIFGQNIASKNGTRDKQYEPPKLKDERGFGVLEYHNINVMKEYADKCSDELRNEDYNLGRRPNPSNLNASSNVMGGSMMNNSLTGSGMTMKDMVNSNAFGSSVMGGSSNVMGGAQNQMMQNSNPLLGGSQNQMMGTSNNNMMQNSNPMMGTTSNVFGTASGSSNPFANMPQTSTTSTSSNPFANMPQTTTSTTASNPFANMAQSTSTTSNPFANMPQTTSTSSNPFANMTQTAPEQKVSFGSVFPKSETTGGFFGSQTKVEQVPSSGFSSTSTAPAGGNIFGGQQQDTTEPRPNFFTETQQQTTFPNTSMNNLMMNNNNTTSFMNNTSMMNNPNANNTSMMNNTSFMNMNTNPMMNNTSTMTGYSCSQVDKSDPYGTKNMKFQFVEKELSPFQRLLAEPIQKDQSKIRLDSQLEYRSPEPEKSTDVYFTPSLSEIRGMHRINNMTLTFPGKGKIEYLEPIKVEFLNIDNVNKKILFTKDHVYVTDNPGEGLNLSAKVTIEKMYPICKTDKSLIIGRPTTYPQKGIQDRFIYELKQDGVKKYVDYDCNKGMYTYTVEHF